MIKQRLVVTAAVIERDDAFLITRRLRGVHLEGYWEFPGGKCDTGEALAECLRREINEELAVDVVVGAEIYSVAHEYPERVVELHFFACELTGEPHPVLGQEMRWANRADLSALHFPAADAGMIARLTGG